MKREKEYVKCSCKGCESKAVGRIVILNGKQIDACKKHIKEIKKSISGVHYLVPVNHIEYKRSCNWRIANDSNVPDENKKFIVSDGKIEDTAMFRDGIWYIENYHMFMSKIMFWKNVNS